MHVPDHYLRTPWRNNSTPAGPLHQAVLAQVPKDHLVTADRVREKLADYLERHPLERLGLLRGVGMERIRLLTEQYLDDLAADHFLIKFNGIDLMRD